MTENNLCVTVPPELQCYQKFDGYCQKTEPNVQSPTDFGVKVFRTPDGTIEHVAYYSDFGDIMKRVYYNGACISYIRHYRNNLMCGEEEFFDNRIRRKRKYDKYGKICSQYLYEYNKANNISCIKKYSAGNLYSVQYDYDDLNRTNYRKIEINNSVINEQHYKYDILDRLIDYNDLNQRAHVNQLSTNNELLNYTITDNLGNEIQIVNYFNNQKYDCSEISMNGHKMITKDIKYVDNIMLKKPYTTDEDLEMILANLFKDSENIITKRVITECTADDLIDEKIIKYSLPISIRKRFLFAQAGQNLFYK